MSEPAATKKTAAKKPAAKKAAAGAAAKKTGTAAKKPAGRKQPELKRRDLQKAILAAAAAAGEECGPGGLVAYLQRQALATPSPFLTLLGKALAEEEELAAPELRLIELVPAALPPRTEEEAEANLPPKSGGSGG